MANGIPEYDEFKLRVDRAGDGSYHVVAIAPDGGTATGTFRSPISDVELDNFILRVASPRSGVRAFHSSHMEEAKELGRTLFEHLLAEDVGDVYHGARRVADSQGRGLRLSISMTGAPELLEIPWELLYDGGDAFFLSQSIFTPVVRSLDLKSPRPPPEVTLPLRMLGLVSAPDGFPELDVGRERANLEKALAPLAENGAVQLEWLESATLAELDRRIASPDELHVIHYIGHGAYDKKRTQSGILALEHADGRPHEVTGEELAGLLRDERSLRLVVLNSCEGSRASHVDPFSGVASSLLRAGLPAVIGMQTEITDKAAITFSDRLYTALAQGFPIDAALAQARRAIFAAGREVEFGTPVLFMRVSDGRLFDLSGKPPPPPVGRLEAELHAKPAVVRRGKTVTWSLEVRNAGTSELTEVSARDSDGVTRAGPLELEAGAIHECTWTTTAEMDLDECVTVGARGSDGRLVSAQAGAHLEVREGGGLPGAPLIAAAAVALLAIAAVLLVATGVFEGDDDGGGAARQTAAPAAEREEPAGPDARVYPVDTDVPDMDARGDKVAFIAAPGGGDLVIRRLDLATGESEDVVSAPKFNGMDVGLNADGHARLVYSRCDAPGNGNCNVFARPLTGEERAVPVPPGECNEVRPSMDEGAVLFARSGPACPPELWLKPAGTGTPPKRIAGATGGADFNDGTILWLTLDGALVARGVAPDGAISRRGRLVPAEGEALRTPLTVEGDHAYFVHKQDSQNFIARTRFPLGSAPIEHYVTGDGSSGAEESPHFGVTADDTLYTTNYPQPNGEPGSRVIVRVRGAEFEPVR